MDIKEKIKIIVKAQSGICYLMGEPGKGKTALLKQIADEENWQYIDLRLSQKDETEVGGIPFREKDQETHHWFFDYATPQWALKANQKPTLVVFEELNRAPLPVRNAALQILNERRMGENFNFSNTVYFAATGNTGTDGCEVEEFDNALWNRIVLLNYDISINDWCKYFADKNVKKEIVDFLKANPECFYMPPKSEKEKVFATPRSWTFLSDMIIKTVGMDAKIKDFYPIVNELAPSYVGSACLRFARYCEDQMQININDVLNRYSQIKDQLKKYGRDKISELLGSLKEIEIKELNAEQLENVHKFLKTVDEDELISFINQYFLDNADRDIEDNVYTTFLKPYKQTITKIMNIIKNEVDSQTQQS